MKVAVISNKKNIKIQKKCEFVVDKLKDNNEIYVDKLDIISDIKKLQYKYDVYMLVTNSVNEVLLCKRKIKNRRKILILTENANVKFIMCCIDFTKNLLYLNIDFDIILQKLYSICAENRTLPNNRL